MLVPIKDKNLYDSDLKMLKFDKEKISDMANESIKLVTEKYDKKSEFNIFEIINN